MSSGLTDMMFPTRKTDSEALVRANAVAVVNSSVAAECNVLEAVTESGVATIASMPDEELIESARAAVSAGKRLEYYVVRVAVEIRQRVESRMNTGTKDADGRGIEANMKRFADQIGMSFRVLETLITAYTRCFPEGLGASEEAAVSMLPRETLIVASRATDPPAAIQKAIERAQEPGFTVAAFAAEVKANKEETEKAKGENREPEQYRFLTVRMDVDSHEALHRLANQLDLDIHTLICRAVVNHEKLHEVGPNKEVVWVPITASVYDGMQAVVDQFNAAHNDSGHTIDTFLEVICQGKLKKLRETAGVAANKPATRSKAA